MLDVHVPEHIRGVRDFMIHLLTITVGLLIALGLESAAEGMHHRHQRREAETLIRQELKDNRAALLEAKPVVFDELKNMMRLRAFLEALAADKATDGNGISIAYHESPIQDAAWRTAASTDVLNYMDYDEVGRFAIAYKQQDMLQTVAEKTLDDYLQLGSILDIHNPSAVTKQTAATALPYVRQIIAHLDGLIAIGTGTLPTYDDALKQ